MSEQVNFPLRNNIRFGNSIQEVTEKETRDVLAQESDELHLVYRCFKDD